MGRTNIKLNRFEPNILPITITVWPFLTNRIVEINSGRDVPKATAKSDRKTVLKPRNKAVSNNE